MSRKIITGIVLTLLLNSMLTLAFNIQLGVGGSDPELTVLAQWSGGPITVADVYIDDLGVGYTGSNFTVDPGTHEVFVNDFWESGDTGNRYCFSHWDDCESANPRNITVNADTTIKAIFVRKYWPGDVTADGRVDDTDVNIIEDVYAGIITDPIWVRLCDVNGDGHVSISDVAKVKLVYYGNVYPVRIGVIGPMAWMQGQGVKEGATLAAEEINATGGILGRPIELVFADTLRGQPYPDNETGTAAAMELMNASCDFVIGGFNSEAVFAAREVFMDNKTIFLIAGAHGNELVDCGNGTCGHCVRCDYDRYKYTFRVMPVNGTTIAKALWNFIRFILEFKLRHYFGGDGVPDQQVRVAVVSENLAVWDEMHWYMTNPSVYPIVLGQYANVTYSARVSSANISAVLQGVKDSGARLLIHLFSTNASVDFIQQWKDMEVNAVPVGINVEAQNMGYWEETTGKCEYETIIAPSGTRTRITPEAVAFYDETLSRYGHSPIYTSWGAHDAIYVLKEAIERAGTTDSDDVVAELEKTDRNGTLGRFKFTQYHDVFCNEIEANWVEGYVRPLVCQWQKSPITGKAGLEVVYPRYNRSAPFAKKWLFPEWISPCPNLDFDHNKAINVFDILLMLIHFRTIAGGPNWDLEYDLNGDGIVKIADLIKVLVNFGSPCSSQSQSMVGVSEATSPIPEITQTNPETTVYLYPATINGTKIGQNFTIYIMISDAQDIYTWQAGLTFNYTFLECTEFEEYGPPAPDALFTGSRYYADGEIHNDTGVVEYGGCASAQAVSGSGRIAYAKFTVKEPGVSDIHLRDVEVTDLNGAIMPCNIIDTYTVARSAAQTTVTVSNSTGVGTAWVDGGTVHIEVGSGFYGHTFSRPAKEISFNVTGPFSGWSNVTIPKSLIEVEVLDQWLVKIDDKYLETEERDVKYNGTHYFIYFNYTLGTHNIRILKRPPARNLNTLLYYAKIQEAINSADPGHRILAFAGIHSENVVVNKTVTLIGENKHNTTIDGSGTGTVINVTADNVAISNFTIQNSGNPEYGILVNGSTNNNINNNIIKNNHIGICLHNSSGNTLTNNNMSGNKYNFGLYGAEDSHFDNTIDESNTVDGKPVYYLRSLSNTIHNSSTNAGTFYLIDCNNVTVRDLTLTKNINGIFLWNTTNSKIQNINVSNNFNGIYLQGQSNDNTLTDNTVSNNEVGIHLHSNNNSVIYHNSFIDNTIQAKVTESYNTLWNTSYSSGSGNYWSDHSILSPFVYDEFKGENQTVQGNDGVVDDPKVIDEENQDNYPLVSPLTPPVYNLNTHRGNTTIQGAVNSAQSGHTIFVRAGTYSEQVTIGKPLTLIGIMKSTVINGTGTVVTITADYVTLRGFTIQGSGSTDKGIFLSYADNVAISENSITKKGYGIWLDHSNSCRISGNTVTNDTEAGIRLKDSNGAIISRNTVTDNLFGIVLVDSSYNDIHRNNVTDNTWGISLSSSNNNTIYHNNFINNPNQVYREASVNQWDDGGLYYLCPICGNPQPRGNYWSTYQGLDNGTQTQAHNCPGDGVGDTDTPHLGVDKYPLMEQWTPQHDVAVVNIPPSRAWEGWGPVSITVTVENQGDYTEKFSVAAYNDTYPIGTQTITLTSESSKSFTFTWDITGVPYGNYTITANATTVLDETDTDDNTYTGWVEVRLWGDLNNNGGVDFGDFGKMKLIYSQVWPYPCPPYDVNRPETYYYLPSLKPPYLPEYLMPDIDGDCKVKFADVGKMKLIYSGYLP